MCRHEGSCLPSPKEVDVSDNDKFPFHEPGLRRERAGGGHQHSVVDLIAADIATDIVHQRSTSPHLAEFRCGFLEVSDHNK